MDLSVCVDGSIESAAYPKSDTTDHHDLEGECPRENHVELDHDHCLNILVDFVSEQLLQYPWKTA
jgi:hypothetical protein